MTPSACLHFLTLAASLFGVGVALSTAWGRYFGKRPANVGSVSLPEGSYVLLLRCALIAVLTPAHAPPVLAAHFSGAAHTAAVAAYVSALFFVMLHILLGAHVFIGRAFRHGDKDG